MSNKIINEMKDGLIFQYNKDPAKYITFNSYTFIELLKGILVKYAKKTLVEANAMVSDSKYFDKPITNHYGAIFFSHELEYHWAMLIAYGDGYGQNGISSNPPDDYDDWERQYIADHHLAESSFEFS